MSNREKTAEVIRTWQARHKTEMDTNPDWAAQNLAGDLANAGLLAPDLPEPQRAWDDDEAPLIWKITDGYDPLAIVVDEHPLGDHPVQLETFNTVIKRLTTAEARRAAHALYAAANYSEGNAE